MKIKLFTVPNIITLCNLLCGCFSIVASLVVGDFTLALIFILASAVCDFFDGFTARLLKQYSDIGVQLDSLADMVSFGVAPSAVMYAFACQAPTLFVLNDVVAHIIVYVPFIMAAFSALRLAKFNIDERQTTSFIGLATPPNAIFWASLVCWLNSIEEPTWVAWILLAGSLLSCYLLVSEIPFFSFKSASKEKALITTFAVGSGLILASCIFLAIYNKQIAIAALAGAICIVWYVICNFFTLVSAKK